MLNSIRFIIASLSAAFAVIVAIGIFVFEDNIAKFFLNPRVPFEVNKPYAAPDYTLQSSWLYYGHNLNGEEKIADIFYIHSNAFHSGDAWNAPFELGARRKLVHEHAIPNEVGPFKDLGRLYIPTYREATQFAFVSEKYAGKAAIDLAYHDIERAFLQFTHDIGDERPFVLVAYGQGGLHAQRLLEEHIVAKPLMRRMVTAYVIDQPVTRDFIDQTGVKICQNATQIRCLNAWVSFAMPNEDSEPRDLGRLQQRSLAVQAGHQGISHKYKAIRGQEIICVNPISWKINGLETRQDEHLGAASATGPKFGTDPVVISGNIQARCEQSILKTSKSSKQYLRHPNRFGDKFKPKNYNLFYEDIRQNAANRIIYAYAVLSEESKVAPPIRNEIDIQKSKIKKIPK